MATQIIDESYNDYFQGDDTFGVPEELKSFMEKLYKKDAITMKELMQAYTLGVHLADRNKDKRRYIANCLHGLCLDYSVRAEDDDLYQMRYGRLLPQIEEELRTLRKPDKEVEETGKNVQQHWASLQWLIEDQNKIVSA